MVISPSTFLLEQRKIQKQLNNCLRHVFDLKYRHFWNDYENLDRVLSTPTQVEEDIGPDKLKGWIPIRLNLNQTSQSVAWLDLGQTSFTDPFASLTICRSWQDQNRPQPMWTKLDVLTALKNISPGLKPKGFIFNVSKCGSTLLSRMLSSLPHNLVISEKETIEQAVRAKDFTTGSDIFSESFRSELLQSVVNALGQPRLGIEKNYIIRFQPTNLELELPFIKKTFPDVPWIFLYREPVEVIVSNLIDGYYSRNSLQSNHCLIRQNLTSSAITLIQMSQQSFNMAKEMLDFSASDFAQMSTEEFQARGLGIIFKMVVQQMDRNALAINYSQLLSETCLRKVLDFFQIEVSNAEIATMTSQLSFYSKEGLRKQSYRDDREDKQKMASKNLRDAVDQWAREPYTKLEEMKLSI
jgi:hypothetical protein